MGTITEAEKQRKAEVKSEKKDARLEKQQVRKEALQQKRDARGDAREVRQDAREDSRDAKQDAREDKRDELQDVRQSNLDSEAKRDEKSRIRDTASERLQGANDAKRDAIDLANQEKKDLVSQVQDTKKEALDQIRERKRTALAALNVPKAFDRKWNSYLRFQEVDALEIYKPTALDHLQSICRIATDNGLKIRAIGSGHSFSQIGVTDDILVETHGLDRMLPLGLEERRKRFHRKHHDASVSSLVELEIGITIFELSKELEKSGKALPNQGTYDGQTFWGAVSTSTHGSGIRRDAFPEVVRSFILVGEGGRTYRIEPTDGITNVAGWREPGVDELIQDDEVFRSAVCSFGCMGIVYSAVIEVRDFYWMNEWGYITTWDTFKSAFANTSELIDFVSGWDDVSMLVVPNETKRGKKDGVSFAGEHPMSLTIRQETDERRQIGNNALDAIAKAFETHHIINGDAPAEGRRWPFLQFTDLKRDDSWMAALPVKSAGKRRWTGISTDTETTPISRRDKCYQIFPKGGKLFGGYGLELAFPIERTIEIMDQLIDLAEANREIGLFHTAPVAIRFVKAATAYASPQFDRTTVMFEILMTKGTESGADALKTIENAMLLHADVRVHWGLHMDQLSDQNASLRTMYPRWDSFEATFRRFNVNGTFHNKFTDRIGLS